MKENYEMGTLEKALGSKLADCYEFKDEPELVNPKWGIRPFMSKDAFTGTFFSPIRYYPKDVKETVTWNVVAVPIRYTLSTLISVGGALLSNTAVAVRLKIGGSFRPTSDQLSRASEAAALAHINLVLTVFSPILGCASALGKLLATAARPSDEVLWSRILYKYPKQLLNAKITEWDIIIPLLNLSQQDRQALLKNLTVHDLVVHPSCLSMDEKNICIKRIGFLFHGENSASQLRSARNKYVQEIHNTIKESFPPGVAETINSYVDNNHCEFEEPNEHPAFSNS